MLESRLHHAQFPFLCRKFRVWRFPIAEIEPNKQANAFDGVSISNLAVCCLLAQFALLFLRCHTSHRTMCVAGYLTPNSHGSSIFPLHKAVRCQGEPVDRCSLRVAGWPMRACSRDTVLVSHHPCCTCHVICVRIHLSYIFAPSRVAFHIAIRYDEQFAGKKILCPDKECT
jgi:hypothetical protein